MTNAQLYLAIGVPLIVNMAFFAIMQMQMNDIKQEIRSLRAEFREDIRILTSKIIELDERLESK